MTGRNFLGIAFRVISLAFAVIAAVVAVLTLVFVTRSVPVPGTVIANSTVQNEIKLMPQAAETGVLYYPVIEYRVASGGRHELIGPRGKSVPQFEIGDEVGVLVSESDPAVARLDTLLGVWGTPIVLGVLAAIFLVISLAAPLGFRGDRTE